MLPSVKRSRSSKRALALYLTASWLSAGHAQILTGNSGFNWGFPNSLSSELTECTQYTVSLISTNASQPNSLGTPPYFMIAFVANGIPTTSFIGTDPTNLTWQVNQASGTNLLLTVADSQGLAGGEPPNYYTVIDGDSSCLPPAPNNNNLRIAANVSTSDKLETCQELGLRVYGGTKPYNVSIAALNSPVVTNITLGPNEDVVTWPNRANPGGQLIVSVSDKNGWGTSSGVFQTTGSSDVNCTGLVTRTGNSANVDQNPSQPSSHSSHAGVIAGVVVAVVVVLLLCGGGYWWWRRRRAARLQPEPAYMPDAWVGPATVPGAELGYITSSESSAAMGEYSPYGPSSSSGVPPTPMRESKLARYRDENAQSSYRRTMSDGSVSGVGMALLGGHAGSSSGAVTPQWNSQDGPPGSDIVIQHRDAGGVGVTEVPPPYLDTRLSGADMISEGSGGASSSVAGASNAAAGPSRMNTVDSAQYLSVSGPSQPAGSSSSRNEKSEKSSL